MVVDWLNLTVAIVTAVATIMTLGVAKNKISPNVETIKNDLSVTIRRAKTELIYKSYSQKTRSIMRRSRML